MTLAIGFGGDAGAARATASRALRTPFLAFALRYAGGWLAYRAGLKSAPASVRGDARLRRVYEQSLLVLVASEDKRYRGASIDAGRPVERPSLVARRCQHELCR